MRGGFFPSLGNFLLANDDLATGKVSHPSAIEPIDFDSRHWETRFLLLFFPTGVHPHPLSLTSVDESTRTGNPQTHPFAAEELPEGTRQQRFDEAVEVVVEGHAGGGPPSLASENHRCPSNFLARGRFLSRLGWRSSPSSFFLVTQWGYDGRPLLRLFRLGLYLSILVITIPYPPFACRSEAQL